MPLMRCCLLFYFFPNTIKLVVYWYRQRYVKKLTHIVHSLMQAVAYYQVMMWRHMGKHMRRPINVNTRRWRHSTAPSFFGGWRCVVSDFMSGVAYCFRQRKTVLLRSLKCNSCWKSGAVVTHTSACAVQRPRDQFPVAEAQKGIATRTTTNRFYSCQQLYGYFTVVW